MGIPTPSKRRRTRTANAVVTKNDSLKDDYIATKIAQQQAILNRQGDFYQYISPFLGASFQGHFRSETDFLAAVEHYEAERKFDKAGNPVGSIHQIPRQGTFRGRFI